MVRPGRPEAHKKTRLRQPGFGKSTVNTLPSCEHLFCFLFQALRSDNCKHELSSEKYPRMCLSWIGYFSVEFFVYDSIFASAIPERRTVLFFSENWHFFSTTGSLIFFVVDFRDIM